VSAQFSVRCFVRTPFCGPSLRSSPGLDIPNHRSTLQVRARFFVSAHAQFAPDLLRGDPRYVQVRAWHPNQRLMLQVRARSFVSAHPLAALHVRTMILLYMALRRAPSKCRAAAAGAERLVARADARGQILRGAGKSLPRSFRLLQS